MFYLLSVLNISALKHSPSKRKPGERGPRTQSMNEDVPGMLIMCLRLPIFILTVEKMSDV